MGKGYVTGLLVLLLAWGAKAQELRATVSINTDRVETTNQQVYQTLETAIRDFLNNTRWTSESYEEAERIDCGFVINIVNQNGGDRFSATLQVQSRRPVFSSNYYAPVLNYNDQKFNFRYTEFQPLIYNPNAYTNNLVSLLSYYAYMIIGMDADSFERNAGEEAFVQAQRILNQAQSGDGNGWTSAGNPKDRYWLIENLTASTYQAYRDAMYRYHRLGLDLMASDPEKGKRELTEALYLLQDLSRTRPNAILLQVFVDAKMDELKGVYSGGPKSEDINKVKLALSTIAPAYSATWAQFNQ